MKIEIIDGVEIDISGPLRNSTPWIVRRRLSY
jgi:hypothetical protein